MEAAGIFVLEGIGPGVPLIAGRKTVVEELGYIRACIGVLPNDVRLTAIEGSARCLKAVIKIQYKLYAFDK